MEYFGAPELDEYGEVCNADNTYKYLANALKHSGKIIFGWTDGIGSHFDILLTLNALYYIKNRCTLQDEIMPNDLFISIIRGGAFGFDLENDDKSKDYYAEKLHLSGGPTTDKMADLFNGVIKAIKEAK
jgi:hypothetical protein